MSRRESGELAELAITRCGGICDDAGFVDRGDVGGAVAVGIPDLVTGATERVHQADQADVGSVIGPRPLPTIAPEYFLSFWQEIPPAE